MNDNDKEDIIPSEAAELADQGYSAAGEVGVIKSRRTFTRKRLARSEDRTSDRRVRADCNFHLRCLCSFRTAAGTLWRS